MNILKELVAIVKKFQVNKIEIIDNTGESQFDELYRLIINGEIRTDEEGVNHFYRDTPVGRNNFSKLKSRFKKRILNNLFFIDVNRPEYNEQTRAYYYLWKELAAAKILVGKTAHKSAIEILEKILSISIRIEFPDLAREASKELSKTYGGIFGDRKNYDKYYLNYQRYKRESDAESLAEMLYCDISIYYISRKDKTSKEVINKKAAKYFEQIQNDLAEFTSPRLHLCGRLIETIKFISNEDYFNAISVCETAISFFESKNIISKTSILIFSNRLLVLAILIKDFSKGKIAAEKGKALSKSYNYYWNRKHYFILCFYSREYKEAYNVIADFFAQDQRSIPDHLKESWLLYKAYTQYLISIGKITPPSISKKFRLGKFLNEVPEFSKDKRGMNIPILIIQILFLIHRKKHDDAINRIESLQWYGAKHIRKDKNFRTNYFIKMLGQLSKTGFSAKRIERHAEKYKQKLLSMPIDKADQAFEIEVIPYEDLWGMVVESL